MAEKSKKSKCKNCGESISKHSMFRRRCLVLIKNAVYWTGYRFIIQDEGVRSFYEPSA